MKSTMEIKTSSQPVRGSFAATGVQFAITFFVSALLANARILNDISGFGVPLAAALPSSFTLVTVLGSLFGYLLFGGLSRNIVYVIALLIVFVAKLGLSKFLSRRASPVLLGCLAAAAMLAAGLTFSFIEQANSMTTILRILQSGLAFAVTYFAHVTFKVLKSGRSLSQYNTQEYYSLAMMVVALLVAVCGIQVGGMFSLGRTAALVLVLLFTRRNGETGGLVCGVMAGLAAGLYDPTYAAVSGMMIISAFFAGVFARFNKLVMIAIFIVANTCGFFVMGELQRDIPYMVDVFAASILFMLLPERVSQPLTIRPKQGGNGTSKYSVLLSSKLQFAASTIQELKGSLETVSRKMSDRSANDFNTVIDATAESVCKNCGRKLFCWETAYSSTMDGFTAMTQILRQEGAVTAETMPNYLQIKCCKLPDLTMMSNFHYQEHLSRESANRKVNEAKLVATEQFEGIADMLCEIGGELEDVTIMDDEALQRVESVLRKMGVVSEEVCCLMDKHGRMCIEVYAQNPFSIKPGQVSEALSSALERDFDLPSMTMAGDQIKLSFFEAANYSVDFKGCQVRADNESYCGDSYEYFLDSRGYAYMILSDGMGSGGRAAIDSSMTCAFILKLMKAGFGFESAIKLINSSLLVKASDESLATIDIVKLDLYTGQAEFLKAGATATYVLRGSSAIKIESTSFPVGILKGATFDRSQIKLARDDVVVMVSDGVTASGVDWVASELELGRKKSAKELAERIAGEAKRRRIDGRSDDITVLVSRVEGR